MGNDKCQLLNGILGRPIHNYEVLQCPDPKELKSDVQCFLTCHSYPHMRYATRNAWALHYWLQYQFRTKSYIKCPPKHTRHTAQYSSGVPKPNSHVTSLVSAAVYKHRSSITTAFNTTMSAAVGDNSRELPKPVDACTYMEGQLLFGPNKVLLRHVFFLDPEKNKYICGVLSCQKLSTPSRDRQS